MQNPTQSSLMNAVIAASRPVVSTEMLAERILKLEALCADIRDEIDNHYDVDTIVGEGTVTYRETPYAGAGEHLSRLTELLGAGGRNTVSVYQRLISEALSKSGHIGKYDLRHIEAWMRNENGTLDGLSRERFAAEVEVARRCEDADSTLGERLAGWHGL